jgi:Cu/Ag efflux protein CusF
MLGASLGVGALLMVVGLVVIAPASPVDADTPCCVITTIDAKTRRVTARDERVKRTLEFKVLDPMVLRQLKVGQRVFADFKIMKVSVRPDGRAPCCDIVFVSSPRPAPRAPCCGIIAIDDRTGIVTATEIGTKRRFQFKVADQAALRRLRVGQAIHADFAAMRVSLRPDGLAPCCPIVRR